MRYEKTLPDGRVIEDAELALLMQEAREWMRKSLDAQGLATDRCNKLVERAIKELIGIYRLYGEVVNGHLFLDRRGDRKRLDVLYWLIQMLDEEIDEYADDAVDDEEDIVALLGRLNGEYHGKTNATRVNERAAYLLAKATEAIEKHDSLDGLSADDVLTGLVGVGALKRLVATEVGRGWQIAWQMQHDGKRYVHVFRGSSYDCAICDDEVAKGWQPADLAEYPPFHANCCCYVIFY